MSTAPHQPSPPGTPGYGQQPPYAATPAAGFVPAHQPMQQPVLSLVPPIASASGEGIRHPDPLGQQPQPTASAGPTPIAPVKPRAPIRPLIAMPMGMPIANAMTIAPIVQSANQYPMPGMPGQMPMGQIPAATAFPMYSAPPFAAPYGYPQPPAFMPPMYMQPSYAPQTYVAMVSLWPQPQAPMPMYAPSSMYPPMPPQPGFYPPYPLAPMPAMPYGYGQPPIVPQQHVQTSPYGQPQPYAPPPQF